MSASMFLYSLRNLSKGLGRFGHVGVGFDVFSGRVLDITLLRKNYNQDISPWLHS